MTLSDAPTVMGLPRIASRSAEVERPGATRVRAPDALQESETEPPTLRVPPKRTAGSKTPKRDPVPARDDDTTRPPSRVPARLTAAPIAAAPVAAAPRLSTTPRPASAHSPTAPRASETRFILGVVLVLGLSLAGLGAWVAQARGSLGRSGGSVSVPTAQARAFRDTAFVHFGAGRLSEAVTALEQGHKARPHPAFVLDIALVQAAWEGHCDDALRTLRRFHEVCASCPTRSEARAQIDTVHTRCAVDVMIDSTPMGATIHLDGTAEGSTPVMLHVTPGEHDVRLELEGYEPLRLDKVQMLRGQRRNFTFELTKRGT